MKAWVYRTAEGKKITIHIGASRNETGNSQTSIQLLTLPVHLYAACTIQSDTKCGEARKTDIPSPRRCQHSGEGSCLPCSFCTSPCLPVWVETCTEMKNTYTCTYVPTFNVLCSTGRSQYWISITTSQLWAKIGQT